jgi:hypothetical protein
MAMPINWKPNDPPPLRLVKDVGEQPESAGVPRVAVREEVPAPQALTPAQIGAIAAGRKGSKKIRRAAGVASFGGWSAAIMAGLSAPFALGSVEAGVMAAVLGIVAWNELAGAKGLRRFEPQACVRLGLNQIFLGAALVGYALYKLNAGVSAQSLLGQASSGDPQVDGMLISTVQGLHDAIYGILAAFGLLVPGLTALYYFTRRPLVKRFAEQTPSWVLDVIRATGR